MSRKKEIDAKDIDLLNIVRKDANISNKALADKLELSPPPTHQRHTNLVKRDYIQSYQAKINLLKLGYSYMSLVAISVAEPNYKDMCLALKLCDVAKSVYTIPANQYHTRIRVIVMAVAKSEKEFVDSFDKVFKAVPFEVIFTSYKVSEIVKDDLSVNLNL